MKVEAAIPVAAEAVEHAAEETTAQAEAVTEAAVAIAERKAAAVEHMADRAAEVEHHRIEADAAGTAAAVEASAEHGEWQRGIEHRLATLETGLTAALTEISARLDQISPTPEPEPEPEAERIINPEEEERGEEPAADASHRPWGRWIG